MRKNNFIDLNDMSKNQWQEIVSLAAKIYESPKGYAGYCSGKILATLFYEPSTRTQMSFQTAMLKLGGSIIGFDNPQNSSVSKGENLVDTIKVVSSYADIIAMRHPLAGAQLAAAQYADCPIINAGDGGHLHPTQTLTDLVTLAMEIGDISGITIGLCGDLKNGRTVHSLIKALCLYKNVKFVLISTDELTVPDYFKALIAANNCTYVEMSSLEGAIPELDVLYMTRIQKERFASEELYNREKNVYILDTKKLELAKPTLKVMHPLPRVDEISLAVDNDPRAIYFKQAAYGVYARMALIITLLRTNSSDSVLKGENMPHRCTNLGCITNHELYLTNSYIHNANQDICEYCDTPWR